MVPVDLAYVIFIDFLALGVLGFCFLLLSNVQFLVLVNLPPGRSHAGGISSRHSRRRYPNTGFVRKAKRNYVMRNYGVIYA